MSDDLRDALAWSTFWVGFGLLDYTADRHGRSLCTSVRWLFRTHTPVGRLALSAVFGTGAMVLHRHLMKHT